MTTEGEELGLREMPTCLLSTPATGAWFLPGRSRRLVVVFGGIGRNPTLPPPLEFIGTASMNGENGVLILNDMRRTWYSHAQVLEEIRSVTSRLLDQVQPETVLGLGNSMGAYGAILLSEPLGFHLTFAISPQFSMMPGVVAETRWRRYHRALGPLLVQSLGHALETTPNPMLIVHGAGDKEELQYAPFPKRDILHHGLVPRVGHKLAARLKMRGLLVPTVEALLKRDIEGAKAILGQRDITWLSPKPATQTETVET